MLEPSAATEHTAHRGTPAGRHIFQVAMQAVEDGKCIELFVDPEGFIRLYIFDANHPRTHEE